MCLKYPNLPKGEFLIQYHKTNKIHMEPKVKILLTVTTRNLILVCYIPPFIWGSRQVITSSLYSSTIAWHDSGMKVEIVFLATRKPNYSVVYLSPAAKCRKVFASFKPGSKVFSITCCSFESVAQLCSVVHRTFLVASVGNWKTNARLQFLALPKAGHTGNIAVFSPQRANDEPIWIYNVHCFCLLLRHRNTRNAACAPIMVSIKLAVIGCSS